MHARVCTLGVGKGVLFRVVSSVQECPYREIHIALSPIEKIMSHFEGTSSNLRKTRDH